MTWIYLDGSFVTSGVARVAALDAGLLYGRGLFETFRARQGAVYLLERHAARLEAGAGVLDMRLPAELGDLAAIVRELTERCGLDDARVRLTLTAGPAEGRPSLLVQARAAADYPERAYERGVSAAIASARRNETSPLSRVKSLNYLDNLLAREAAQRVGADDALLLNVKGLLADGSASNVFVVRDGELVTPPVKDGALPGITRAAVLDLAAANGLSAREASLTAEELRRSDDAFLTNAVAGVLPLVSVDGVRLGVGTPGEMTHRVRALYEEAARNAA